MASLSGNNNADNDYNNDNGSNNNRESSLIDRLRHATAMIETSPAEAVTKLEQLQKDITTLSLFSTNESLQDISTASLPFISLDHCLAMALISLPAGPGKMRARKANILKSFDLWSSFLSKLEAMELLSNDEQREYQQFLQMEQQQQQQQGGEDDSKMMTMIPPPNREAKIARFRAKKQAQNEMQRLMSLRERRQRLDAASEDEMDGHDEDSLLRTLYTTELTIYKSEAFENWAQSQMELPMIEMMVQREKEQTAMNKHTGKSNNNDDNERPLSGKPLQVTHITKNSATGELQIKKDEIKSKVFRPGWNQPTMTLAELGERERQQAIEREARQKAAEDKQAEGPRRYEYLLKDGLEDETDLVDASAQLDREWDNWKDENPRGSGNKMGERGDRNF